MVKKRPAENPMGSRRVDWSVDLSMKKIVMDSCVT